MESEATLGSVSGRSLASQDFQETLAVFFGFRFTDSVCQREVVLARWAENCEFAKGAVAGDYIGRDALCLGGGEAIAP